MYKRLLEYLTISNIPTSKQYDFSEKHSTYMLLLKRMDDISDEVNNSNYSIGIYRFVESIRQCWSRCLNKNGIKVITLDCIKDYLTNRFQYVSINNTISHGFHKFPIRSILGNLSLFILYINDFVNTSSFANLILFADGTNLLFTNLLLFLTRA